MYNSSSKIEWMVWHLKIYLEYKLHDWDNYTDLHNSWCLKRFEQQTVYDIKRNLHHYDVLISEFKLLGRYGESFNLESYKC